jgi:hypothetical protein
MITMGLLLGGSEADKYYPNPFFWTKLVFLACIGIHALIFRPLVYNKTREIDAAPAIPPVAKTAAILSLVLWFGVLTMGRLIGYYEGPKDKQAFSPQGRISQTSVEVAVGDDGDLHIFGQPHDLLY